MHTFYLCVLLFLSNFINLSSNKLHKLHMLRQIIIAVSRVAVGDVRAQMSTLRSNFKALPTTQCHSLLYVIPSFFGHTPVRRRASGVQLEI
uniref:Secreted protein n=1 Tax=Rhipicephalus appendiculatus TaxID=34631 RepID=A0A131YC31_RHIAP